MIGRTKILPCVAVPELIMTVSRARCRNDRLIAAQRRVKVQKFDHNGGPEVVNCANVVAEKQVSVRKDPGVTDFSSIGNNRVIQTKPPQADHDPAGWKASGIGHARAGVAGASLAGWGWISARFRIHFHNFSVCYSVFVICGDSFRPDIRTVGWERLFDGMTHLF